MNIDKPTVLLLNPILIPAINEKLDALYNVVRLFEHTDKDACIQACGPQVRGVVTGGHAGITQALMARLPALQVVAVNGVGTDAVDLNYARSRGIPVSATLGALTEDVADMAIGLLLAACRGLGAGDRHVRSGEWGQTGGKGGNTSAMPLARRFSGMRVGIVGLGRVGRAIATRAVAFGCPVSYTDLQPMGDVPYTFVADLKQLAHGSDALILAAAADKAGGIINAEVLDALGPDGFLVNVARGKLVNEADLMEALSTGRIAGAGLDVFADEPRVPSTLRELENVALQPHRASATVETRTAMGNMVLASLARGLAGLRPEISLTT